MEQHKVTPDTSVMNQPLLKQLSALGSLHLIVLYLIALSVEDISKSSLLGILQKHQKKFALKELLDTDSFSQLLLELTQSGWIKKRDALESTYTLQIEHHNGVLLHLFMAKLSIDWRRILSQILDWSSPSIYDCQRELWLAMLKGDSEETERWSRWWPYARGYSKSPATSTPLKKLFANQEGYFLFERLAEDVQVILLINSLGEANKTLDVCSKEYQYALSFCMTCMGRRCKEHHILVDLLAQQAFFRGDREQLRILFSYTQGKLCSFMLDIAQGHYEQAAVYIEAWDKDLKKENTQHKSHFSPNLQIFIFLALLGCGDQQSYAALRALMTEEMSDRLVYSLLWSFMDCLQAIVTPPSPLSFHRPPPLWKKKSALVGFEGFLLALVMYWSGDPDSKTQEWKNALEVFHNKLIQEGYHWVAHELDALYALQFEKVRLQPLWHEERQLTPLVEIYKHQEAWGHALDALSALKPKQSTQQVSAPPQERLAWLVVFQGQDIQLEPREQKLGAKGQWSKGRSTSLQKLATEYKGINYLLPQDVEVIRGIRKEVYYNRKEACYSEKYNADLQHMLPRLIGHPHVFLGDTSGASVDVVEGKVVLHLKEGGEHIQMNLVPSVGSEDKIIWERETPTRLVVTSINEDVRRITKIIRQGLVVPRLAKAQLITSISNLAPLVPIYSNLPELGSHMKALPADNTLYAHLLPAGEGVRLQFFVKPFSGGGWFKPGHGLENILGEQDGKTIQVTRDLEGERQAYTAVLEACPSLSTAESDGQEWVLTDPHAALESLSELQAVQGSASMRGVK